MSHKTILFCGNGMSGEAVPHIKSMGYKVFLITEFPKDRGLDQADAVIEANSKEPILALSAAETLAREVGPFDGVLSLCWDSAISVSAIAERFGLRGNSLESARNTTLKDRRSDILAKSNLDVPKHLLTSSLNEAYDFFYSNGGDIVVKPIDSSSSKGVTRVCLVEELDKAIAYASSFSKHGQVVLNQFLSGTEHSVEGMFFEGVFFPTGITDRIFEYEKYAPYFVEVGDVMPTALPPMTVSACYKLTETAAIALGVKVGPVKADIVVSNGKPYLLELAGRLGGPRLGQEMIRLGNGTNILKAAVQQAVGDFVNMEYLRPKWERGMTNRSLFPPPGTVTRFHVSDEIRKVPGFYDFKPWNPLGISVGDKISTPTYGCGDLGYLITFGLDREAALKAADAASAHIEVSTTRD